MELAYDNFPTYQVVSLKSGTSILQPSYLSVTDFLFRKLVYVNMKL